MTTIVGGAGPTGGPGRVHKYDAIVPPTANDDVTDGYQVGSFWFDRVLDNGYVCTNAAQGAAVWVQFDISDQITDGTNTVTAAQGRAHIDSVANPHSVVANQVNISDAGANFTATEVEAALAEEADARQAHVANSGNPHSVTAAQVDAPTNATFSAHAGDTANPHGVVASQVSITDAGANFTATEVEAALAEEADARQAHAARVDNPHSVTAAQVGAPTSADLTSHTGNTSNPHSVTRDQLEMYLVSIDTDGTALEAPAGWSTSRVSTGRYRITHNLGHTNFAVLATSRGSSSFANHHAPFDTTVITEVTTKETGTGTLHDDGADVQVIVY